MGKSSQAEGKAFEEFFELMCNRFGLSFLKLLPGAKIIGSDQSGMPKWKLVPCPFDYVVGGRIEGNIVSAYIDCKSIGDDTFYSSMIDWDQIVNLLNFESAGHPSGYVIHFRKIHKIVFIKAGTIQSIGNSRSLKPSDGLGLGDLYTLDLKKLWL